MPEYSRGRRNWHTAMGLLFIISAAIVFARQIILVGPEFFRDNLINATPSSEKVSLAMVIFGVALILYGLRASNHAI